MIKRVLLALVFTLLYAVGASAQVVQAPGTVNANVDTTALEALFGGSAAAGADNTANPTLGAIFNFPMVFDGSTWDRWTGAVTCSNCSGTGASKVDGAAFTVDTDSVAPMGAIYDTTPGALTDGDIGLVRMSDSRYLYVIFPSAQAVTGTVDLGATDNAVLDNIDADLTTIIGHVDGIEGVLGTIDTDTGNMATSLGTIDNAYAADATAYAAVRLTNGTSFLTPASDATHDSAVSATGPQVIYEAKDFDGSALPNAVSAEGDAVRAAASLSGVPMVMVVNEDGSLERGTTTTPYITNDVAATTGGADDYSYISVGTTEDEHAVKATAGTLYSITATNTNAAVRYLKCEDDTAANTAPGTDTPELRIAIPGATTGAGFTADFPKGWAFANALTCWLVTGAADNDVAEVAANEIMVFYTFK